MIYEMRTYELKVGTVQEFEENFSKVIEKIYYIKMKLLKK